jgi:hypothetical protein
MTTTLQVLHVHDCPNLTTMLDRLRESTDLPVTTREVGTASAAARAGMNGSPTLLINGRDPFLNPDHPRREHGLSCRIYRDEHGRVAPAPSVSQLRNAVAAAGRRTGPSRPRNVGSLPPSRPLTTSRVPPPGPLATTRRPGEWRTLS